MRHRVFGKRLGRDGGHKASLLKNLSIALLQHGHIETTLAKAKAVKPFVEQLITTAKIDSVSTARQLSASLFNNASAVTKLRKDLGKGYASRKGGYTRIVKMGSRAGDQALMARLELLEVKKKRTVKVKPEETKNEDK